MTTPVMAVVTNDARRYWPQFFGQMLGVGGTSMAGAWNPLIKYFRVGEGGWMTSGPGQVPRTPDADLRRVSTVLDYTSLIPIHLQDLDIIVDQDRLLVDKRYTDPTHQGWYEQPLAPTDFTFVPPASPGLGYTLEVSCLLDTGKFNDNGSSLSPQIWEIGLFADHPLVAPSPTVVNPPTWPPASRLMVAYGTFPMEIKINTRQIEHKVHLIF